jgi:hypothetical protein
MALAKPLNRTTPYVSELLLLSIISIVLGLGSAASAAAQENQQSGSDEAWTATTESSVANTNPSRTTESHNKSGNRTVDKKRQEVLGLDGKFRPDSETETETIRVNDTTTRTVVRTYKWDGNGRRSLAQLTEEDVRSTASGDSQSVRTTSSADVNGNIQVVKREVADTRQMSPDVQETKTKVYLADGNGGFTMAVQSEEQQKRRGEHSVDVKKTTLLPDGNGNWKVGEVNEKTIKEEGKKRSTEERTSRPDSEGRLAEFSRTVGEETENSNGQRSSTVESYSRNIPGSTDDGSMHRTQRVTTLKKRDASEETTEQQVEEPNPGNPSDGPRVTARTKYTVQYAASSSEKTKTVEVRDGNGTFQVFSETKKSEQIPSKQVPTAPSDKPQ